MKGGIASRMSSSNEGQTTTSRARRLSEVTGISAIFNPRKHRRNSAAVSQLLSELGPGGRNPSVVVTDDDQNQSCEDLTFPPRAVSFERSNTSLGLLGNGPAMNRGETSGGGRGISSAGSGTSASSVPLLADVQAQSGNSSHAIVTIESSLIHQSSIDRPGGGSLHGHGHHGLRDSRDRESNNNNNTHLKPIAKTFATIRRAIFSKTARKVR